MSRTIQTSCTKTFWGTSTGISVCRSYKGLFAFTAIGTAATIASVWLDIIVRRRETRFGKYGQMTSETALGDVKLEDRNSAYLSAPLPPPPGPGTGVHDDDPWNVPHPVNARDGYPPEYWGGDRDSLDAGHHAAVERDYYGDSDYYYGQQTPAWSQGPRSRLGRREYEYSYLPEQTGYDPAAYR
ncbi:hypothetical protein PHISCL_06155 [Aspergillus sclerotialis]|uniref:Uncharacterized protein n=1 Tax=Aspergillus sclerotialis TaxID=2070753 RepID=A0A3A2ZGU2_9EURO|nr:hypothetical protein PHISCL_06155 [Aspergillus sclerotialis]